MRESVERLVGNHFLSNVRLQRERRTFCVSWVFVGCSLADDEESFQMMFACRQNILSELLTIIGLCLRRSRYYK